MAGCDRELLMFGLVEVSEVSRGVVLTDEREEHCVYLKFDLRSLNTRASLPPLSKCLSSIYNIYRDLNDLSFESTPR